MKNYFRNNHSKRGQAVIESILIMVVLFGLTQLVFNVMKGQQGGESWMSQLVGAPSSYLKSMARSGVWEKSDQDIRFHPNRSEGHLMNSGRKIKK